MTANQSSKTPSIPNPSIPTPSIPMSPFQASHDLLFLSGQLAFDAAGKIRGDIEAQTTQCLANIEAVLKAQGRAKTDIIKTTVWLTDKGNFAAYNNAYRAFFGDGPYPARSTVVSELVLEGALIEIEVIARK